MTLSKIMTLSIGLALASAGAVSAEDVPKGTMRARDAMPRHRQPPAPAPAPAPDIRPGQDPRTAPKAGLPTARPGLAVSAEETAVIDQLHAAHVIEIQAGNLAAVNGGTEDVKQYGAHIARDHVLADQELGTVAERNGVQLPGVDTGKLENLKRLRGREFDRAFLDMMVRDHQNAISMVRTARRSADNQDVRALLDRTLPTLQQHEEHAQQLNDGHS